MDLKKNDVNFKRSSSGVLTLNDANIKGFGKSSIDLLSNEIILKASESTFTVRKPINDIDFLIYSKGNFFFDDTIYMGINGEQYEISCKNDEIGLRNLYDNLVRTKAKNPQSPILQQNNQTNINQTNNLNPPEEEHMVSTSEEIRNFYNLMKEGIISEEEFEEKKKELLKSK